MSKINRYRRKYEDYLGYKIGPEFDVHHIDCDHQNSAVGNMVFLPRRFHENYHATKNRLIDLCLGLGFTIYQLPNISVDESFNLEDYKSGSYLQWWKGLPVEYEVMCYRNIRAGWLLKRGATLIEALAEYDNIIRETKELQKTTRDVENSKYFNKKSRRLEKNRLADMVIAQAKKNVRAFCAGNFPR